MSSNTEPLLTVKIFKDRYLFGVDLRDDNGKLMANKTISDKIKQATAYVQNQLDLCILPEVFSANDETQEKKKQKPYQHGSTQTGHVSEMLSKGRDPSSTPYFFKIVN